MIGKGCDSDVTLWIACVWQIRVAKLWRLCPCPLGRRNLTASNRNVATSAMPPANAKNILRFIQSLPPASMCPLDHCGDRKALAVRARRSRRYPTRLTDMTKRERLPPEVTQARNVT